MLVYHILAASLLFLCKHKSIPVSITYFSCAVDRQVGKVVKLFSGFFPLKYLAIRKWRHIYMQLR